MLLYMCPHKKPRSADANLRLPHTLRIRYACATANLRLPSQYHFIYMCPHTAIYVSSYAYICVLILLYMCPLASSYCYICVLILVHMCPHTRTYVSSKRRARRDYSQPPPLPPYRAWQRRCRKNGFFVFTKTIYFLY